MNNWRTRFEAFHAANPKVYDLYKRFALQLYNAGRRKFSSTALIERIRWEANVTTTFDDGFKVNQNFARLYKQKLCAEMPSMVDCFTFRGVREE